MTCNLTLETFNGKIAGDSFLDNDWKCRTCQLSAGAHPRAQDRVIVVPQIIDYRERFENFLRMGGITPCPNIMSRLQRLRDTVIITAETRNDALFWYKWVQQLPQTITRDNFLKVTGYTLSGMHLEIEGILHAWNREGRMYMLKLLRPATYEALFASKVNGKPFIVASSYQCADHIDTAGVRHFCGGLLMRRFDLSLSAHRFKFSVDVLLNRCKAMIIAINSIHSANVVHMDIKASNIFLRDGLWFLGDFGACVNHGDPIRATTEDCYMLPINEILGSPAQWHHDWFAMALVFVRMLQDKYLEECQRETVLAAIQTNCEEVELKELLTRMVDCKDQLMHFEGEAEFAKVIDEI